MPWRLRKAPKRDLYWVVDDKNKHYSKDPMPRDKAVAQLRALYASEDDKKGSGAPADDWVVAIPSYDRPQTLKDQTLNTLKSQGVPNSKIVIFVANNEELKKYKDLIGSDYKFVVGQKGLVNQLRFIVKHFPAGKPIVRMDDDVKEVFKKTGGKGSHEKKKINLSDFFTDAFSKLKELNLNLWGVNKVSNPFMMTPGHSTDLRLVVGPLNGFFNQKDPKYDYKTKEAGMAEDIEKTIRYFMNDGGVLRFNDVGFVSPSIVKEGGIATDVGGLSERLKRIKDENRELAEMYGAYGKIVPNKLQGEVFQLHRRPKVKGAGFFDSVKSLASKARSIVKEKLKPVVRFVNDRKDDLANVGQYITGLATPSKLNPASQRWLDGNKDFKIIGAVVKRAPIQKYINVAFNLITGGKWEEAKKAAQYDNLFHLALMLELERPDGTRKKALIEKNQVLNFTDDTKEMPKTEYFPIPITTSLTVGELIRNTESLMGPAFYKYSAFDNNCQNFIVNVLKANGLLTPEAEAFIYQPLDDLLKKQPSWTKNFSKFITNLGGITDRILHGYGETHRQSVLKKYKLEDKPYSLEELAEKTSVPLSILQEVFNRGIGAYKTQGQSVRLKHSFVKNVKAPMNRKLSKEQWAYARVFSFLDGNPKHDNDLRRNKGGSLLGCKANHSRIKPLRVGGVRYIRMPVDEFKEEHARLLDVLDHPTPEKLKAEAKAQRKELKGGDYPPPSEGLPSVEEFLASRGYDPSKENTATERLGETSFKEVEREGDVKKYDESRFKDAMSNVKSWEQYELLRAKNPNLMPYDQYKALAEKRAKSYATSNISQEVRRASDLETLKEKNALIKEYFELFPDEALVNCSLDENGDPIRDRPFEGVKTGECKRRHALYNEKMMSPTDRFFNKLNTGLAQIADTVVENIPLPGVGQVVGSLYKEFAPPGSKFYKGQGSNSANGIRLVITEIDPAESHTVDADSSKGRGRSHPKSFADQLREMGVSKEHYLKEATKSAKKYDYPPPALSSDGRYKLELQDKNGKTVRFGRTGYGDYILYKVLEAQGKVPKGTAQKKQNVFHRSHTKIKGDWKANPFSPNNLALRVLW